MCENKINTAIPLLSFFNFYTGSEFLKAVISEHGRFFIMFLKRDKSCN